MQSRSVLRIIKSYPSESQKEVLCLAAEGMRTRDMAKMLHLGVKSLEKHRASMMRKLELQSLPDLIKFAIRKGLIEMDES